MDYVLLGQTGLHVSSVGLGTYNFGKRTDFAEATEIVGQALDAGCNLIDTANSYGRGASEALLGEVLSHRREDVILCTKVFNEMGPGPNDRGNSAWSMRRELHRSLQRLKTDRIDIYFLHRHDPTIPIEDVIVTLDSMVKEGKIRYYGFSTFPTSIELGLDPCVGVVPTWRLADAISFASRHGMNRVACEQVPYNLIEREVESHILPLCREKNTGTIGYSPLAMGALTEKSAQTGEEVRFDSWFDSQAPEWRDMLRARESLRELARSAGLTLEQLAMGWAVRRGAVDCVLIGPRTVDQARRALDMPQPLSPDLIEGVDSIVSPGTSLWMRPSEAIYRRQAREAGSQG